MKVDKDEIISVDHHIVSPAARDSASSASVIVLDGDSEEPEVRSKLERTSADSVSQETLMPATAGGNSKREGQSLFYLTRVRGIGSHYNCSNVTIGIKGKLNYHYYNDFIGSLVICICV